MFVCRFAASRPNETSVAIVTLVTNVTIVTSCNPCPGVACTTPSCSGVFRNKLNLKKKRALIFFFAFFYFMFFRNNVLKA